VALDTIKTPMAFKKDVLGGSATFFSLSARKFAPVSLVAVVGEDFPRRHISLLSGNRIDIRGLETAPGKTFRWSGEYTWDFNDRKTIFTHLNVFADFKPKVPSNYKNKDFLFLANIDPDLQLDVLRQVGRPKLIACDTMNLWIDIKRKSLLKLLKAVDLFFVNDSEARQLTQRGNLFKAAREILKMGPRRVIIKKGEHGALMFSDKGFFAVPAYLLEEVFDPTGAGDTFAGAVIGYLARSKKVDDQALRRAMVYGTVMATFTVESFGPDKLVKAGMAAVNKRVRELKRFTCF